MVEFRKLTRMVPETSNSGQLPFSIINTRPSAMIVENNLMTNRNLVWPQKNMEVTARHTPYRGYMAQMVEQSFLNFQVTIIFWHSNTVFYTELNGRFGISIGNFEMELSVSELFIGYSPAAEHMSKNCGPAEHVHRVPGGITSLQNPQSKFLNGHSMQRKKLYLVARKPVDSKARKKLLHHIQSVYSFPFYIFCGQTRPRLATKLLFKIIALSLVLMIRIGVDQNLKFRELPLLVGLLGCAF